MSNDIPTMLTIKETATNTGLAQHYIRQLCLQGKIVNVKCGKKYLINYEKFIDFLNSGEQAIDPVCGTGGIRRLG